MKTVEIEGIRLTDDIIFRLKCMQEENGTGAEGFIRELDRAVSFIATEIECPTLNNEKRALSIISGLCQLKEVLSAFTGKEILK